jgi:hypothetical protein
MSSEFKGQRCLASEVRLAMVFFFIKGISLLKSIKYYTQHLYNNDAHNRTDTVS